MDFSAQLYARHALPKVQQHPWLWHRFEIECRLPPMEERSMVHRKQTFLLAILSLAICLPAQAGGLPKRVGECAKTRIKSIETRLENAPHSGRAVSFKNGGYQVSYD